MKRESLHCFFSAIFFVCLSPGPSIAMGQGVTLKEGTIFGVKRIPASLPPGKNHPYPRELMGREEQIVAGNGRILLLQYRADPDKLGRFSMNDDAVVVALAIEKAKYRILLVLQSETAILAKDDFNSADDYEPDFITIHNQKFLYIQNHFSGEGAITLHSVYAMQQDRLFKIPFKDSKKRKNPLRRGEELRNAQMGFQDQSDNAFFEYKSGIFAPQDGECCPTHGFYHAKFELAGKIRPNGKASLRFEETRQWRDTEY